MEGNKRRERRKFSKEYKAEAVRMVSVGGKTATEVGSSLGVSAALIARWCRDAKAGAFGKEQATMMSEAERIRELEKENRELRMERDILKKATAFFAKYQT